MSQLLQESAITQPATTGAYLVALPLTEQSDELRLLPLAQTIARHHGGRVLIVRVVVVPTEQPLSDGVHETRRARAELDELMNARPGATPDEPIGATITVAHSLESGIRTTIHEQRADLLLLGVFLVTSAMVVLFNLLTDLMLRVVDPRIEPRR